MKILFVFAFAGLLSQVAVAATEYPFEPDYCGRPTAPSPFEDGPYYVESACIGKIQVQDQWHEGVVVTHQNGWKAYFLAEKRDPYFYNVFTLTTRYLEENGEARRMFDFSLIYERPGSRRLYQMTGGTPKSAPFAARMYKIRF